jgi:enolase
MSNTTIAKILGREVIDSRGSPTQDRNASAA